MTEVEGARNDTTHETHLRIGEEHHLFVSDSVPSRNGYQCTTHSPASVGRTLDLKFPSTDTILGPTSSGGSV